MNILVLHGPNLNLLGERPGDQKGQTLDVLNAQIEERAASLGATVRILQSNHEGAIIDALHQARAWADAVIINPGALTHSSYALREAIAAVAKPIIEVHLTDIRRRESWRRKSVIKDVCDAQILGKGFDSYFLALERLAGRGGERATALGARVGAKKRSAAAAALQKTLGRAEAPLTPAPRAQPVKTLGRRLQQAAIAAGSPVKPAPKGSGSARNDVVSRAMVRQKIADRLAGKLSPAELSTWARSKWLEVQRGAPAEMGHRELLEDSLQQLALSSTPPARLTDEQLIELMTQLDS